MRVLLLGAAMISTMSGGALAAPKAPPVTRSVELIAMGGRTRRDPAPGGQVAPAELRTETPIAPASADFKVHDLSRRWVEFQMANRFSSENAASPPSDDEGSFVLGGPAQPGVSPAQIAVPPAASIPVPLWMRGGSVFAAAATSYVPGCYAPGYRPAGFLAADAEMRRASYYGMMSNVACQYGIPVGLFDAMIIRESRYRPDAFSSKSAFGLTQLMPGTAIALGVNRYSVEENLRGGAKYLRQQLDRFGHYHLALAAYNAGPGRVRNGLVPPIAETRAYVDNVLLNWSRLSGVYRQATVVPRAPTAASSEERMMRKTAAVSTF